LPTTLPLLQDRLQTFTHYNAWKSLIYIILVLAKGGLRTLSVHGMLPKLHDFTSV